MANDLSIKVLTWFGSHVKAFGPKLPLVIRAITNNTF